MTTAIIAEERSAPSALPLWARPEVVPALIGGYFLVYLLIVSTLHSTLGVDNAIENYNAQSWALSYSPRNPPLYDWLLILIQQVTGSGALGLSILNYGSLCACVMVIWQIARKTISDARLAAITAYSYLLLWDIGHEAHRIITHSNLMIVAIAACVLTVLKLSEQRTAGRYLWLGVWIALGLLAKFGFAAFLAILLTGVLAVPRYRGILADRRFATTAAMASLPAIFLVAVTFVAQHEIVASARVLTTGVDSSLLERTLNLLRSLFGYMIPLLPIALAIFFWRRPREKRPQSAEQRDFTRLLAIMVAVGIAVGVAWALVIGSTQLRPRYFHALILMFPVLIFLWCDCFVWPERRLRIFMRIVAAVTGLLLVEQVAPLLAPSELLCGSCRLSIPYDRLGQDLEARFGPEPTLVGLDPARAGQLRAAVPGARVVTLWSAPYRPPFRATKDCLLVALDDDGSQKAALAGEAGVAVDAVETLDVPWFQPLMSGQRHSRFDIVALAPSSDLCR
jgi:hypothetical protein